MLAAKHIIKISKEGILVVKAILIAIKPTTSFSSATAPPDLPENNKSHSGIEVPHKHYSTLIIGIIFLLLIRINATYFVFLAHVTVLKTWASFRTSLKRVDQPSRFLELILTVFGGTGRGSTWSAYVHKTQYPMYVYRVATSIMDVVNPV